MSEADLLFAVVPIGQKTQSLSQIRKHSQNTRPLPMRIPRDQVRVLCVGDDRIDGVPAAEPGDQLLWSGLNSSIRPSMALAALRKNPEVEAWPRSDLPGRKLSVTSFLSVTTRTSKEGDQ